MEVIKGWLLLGFPSQGPTSSIRFQEWARNLSEGLQTCRHQVALQGRGHSVPVAQGKAGLAWLHDVWGADSWTLITPLLSSVGPRLPEASENQRQFSRNGEGVGRKVGAAQLRPLAWQERISEKGPMHNRKGVGVQRGGLGFPYPQRSRNPRNLRLVGTVDLESTSQSRRGHDLL